MGWIQNLAQGIQKRFSRREVQQGQLDTSLSGLGSSIISQGSYPEQKVLNYLRSADSRLSEHPHAQEWIPLSKLLYNHFSLYERAVNVHADFVGSPVVSEDSGLSDQVKELIEEFWQDLPILSELQPNFSEIAGVDQLTRALVVDTLVIGQAFAQDRFKRERGKQGTEYAGVIRFGYRNFRYEYFSEEIGHILAYQDNQYPHLSEREEIISNPFFHTLKIEQDTESLWGVPLIRGGKLMSDVVIALLGSVMLQSLRFANPVDVTMITQQDKSVYGSPENWKRYNDLTKRFQSKIDDAVRGMYKGKAASVVQGLMGEVDIKNVTFGSDFKAFVDDEMLWKLLVVFCNVLNVPPTLLSIRQGGSGLQSDEFKYAWLIFLKRISALRRALKNTLRRITYNYLISVGIAVDLDDIEIEFSDLDTLTDKEKEELRKLRAEADKLIIENAGNLDMLGVLDDREGFLSDKGVIKDV